MQYYVKEQEKMKTLNLINQITKLVISLLLIGLSACNGGSSSGNNSSASTINSAIDFSGQTQLTSTEANNTCFNVVAATTTQNTIWQVAGSFSVKNTCSSAQKVNGLQINMVASKSSLKSSAFQSYGATGFTFPAPLYWAATTMLATNAALVNNKTSLILNVSTDKNGVLNSGSTATFSYGYVAGGVAAGTISFNIASSVSPTPTTTPTPTPVPSPTAIPTMLPSQTPTTAPTSSCSGIATWNTTTAYATPDTMVVYNNIKYKNNWWTKGDNPASNSGPAGSGKPWTSVADCSAAQTQGTIALTINTTALKSICANNTVCNIPLILSGQNGNFSATVATVTNSNAGNILNVNLTGLNSGSYSLSTPSSSLPPQVTFSAAAITVTANTIVNASANFAVAPITTGAINYTVQKPGEISLVNNDFTINLLNSSDASVGNNTVAFGQATSFNNINTGAYSLTSYGLADAKTGTYYAPLKQTVNVVAGGTNNVGTINLTKVNSGIIPITLNITGLESGDTATILLTDSANYTFNSFTAANGNTQLSVLNSDNLIFNLKLSSKYDLVTPVSVSTSSGKVVNIAITKAPAPAGKIVGYYETWMARATWTPETYSLAVIPGYVNTIPIAFAKPDASYTSGSFSGTGLDFTPAFSLVKASVGIAQAKGQKILLSVGGATYQNFAKINVPALIGIVKDLGLDGIDLDFEPSGGGCSNLNTAQLSCPTDAPLINIITQLRAGLDTIRPGMTLSAAVWSIGAYGTVNYPTSKYGPVGANSGIWVNPLKQVGNKFNEIYLMSYDAGVYTPTGTKCPTGTAACYDPSAALLAYKSIFNGPVYQGIEVPPEAWGGNILTPSKAVDLVSTAAKAGGAGTMLWALQVQGIGYTANSFLQPICSLYYPNNPNLCSQLIPLN